MTTMGKKLEYPARRNIPWKRGADADFSLQVCAP